MHHECKCLKECELKFDFDTELEEKSDFTTKIKNSNLVLSPYFREGDLAQMEMMSYRGPI